MTADFERVFIVCALTRFKKNAKRLVLPSKSSLPLAMRFKIQDYSYNIGFSREI